MYSSVTSQCIQDFVDLGGIRPGFKKANVTLYMHIIAYDGPTFMKRFHSLKPGRQ